MKYNYRKLEGRIVEICVSRTNFAKEMGLSDRSISLKLNNRVPWKQTEISKAMEILKIDPSEVQDYFFNQKVQVRRTTGIK